MGKGGCLLKTALASLVAVFAGWAHLVGLELSDFDPRTPWWLRQLAITKPWLMEKPECAAGDTCEFKEHHFWSPENRTLNSEVLMYFFGRVASPFQNRLSAGLVALHKRYLKRLWASGGSKPVMGLFQIGPNIPNLEEVFMATAYDSAVGNNLRWVLVEPQEPIINEVRSSAFSAGLGPERTFVINAAMCPSAEKDMELWKFKDGAAEESPNRMMGVRKWSTLGGKDVLLNTWRRNVMFEQWPKDQRHEDDLEDWAESVPVKCHTPATLLKEVRMEASNVDVLFIDAEGFDAEILALFRDLPGFNPAVIIFEFAFHHASRGKLHLLPEATNYWSRRGYHIYKDYDNMVIFKTDGS